MGQQTCRHMIEILEPSPFCVLVDRFGNCRLDVLAAHAPAPLGGVATKDTWSPLSWSIVLESWQKTPHPPELPEHGSPKLPRLVALQLDEAVAGVYSVQRLESQKSL